MKKILWISIAVIVIAGVGFGGYQVYGMGHDVGEKNGYNTGQDFGYKMGLEAGYQSGRDDGYQLGHQEGYQVGYDIGKQDSYDSGYSSGLAAGTRVGYQDGYSQGETDGYNTGFAAGLGHGYTIKDPTFAEVLTFLSNDKTDEKDYIEPTYVCAHYSRDVCNSAEAAGIRCSVVEIRYRDSSHLIVAFNTIDKGLVYFEPQSDEQAMPAIGLKYYTTVIPSPGYYYVPPDYDDTILDMVLIW